MATGIQNYWYVLSPLFSGFVINEAQIKDYLARISSDLYTINANF